MLKRNTISKRHFIKCTGNIFKEENIKRTGLAVIVYHKYEFH